MTALPADLREALDDLAALARAGRTVVVASDFDGVLADLVDDPESSRPRPEAAAALARLATAGPHAVLALVSGRDVVTLARLSGAPAGTVLVGSHGAERGVVAPDGTLDARPLDLPAADADRLAAVVRVLEDVAERAEGAWVERKPTSAVLHVRLVAQPAAEDLRSEALERVRALGVDAMLGKDVVDCNVVATSKGAALTALGAETSAARTLYLGDDVTDERAFAALGPDDVTVRVGPGETVARFRVTGTTDAAAVLAHVGDAIVT
ncbi:trehalose-phosphatase [Sanguibacter sp. HDW7]|uniref:trehalose-phosphatase n=1 Tax=Sanguibacter sp. HDW7 TaxID=2714931 RepID=UPI00140CD743|nr:trehalose-phosphatase [Sanguibacter sp. HDW7]QIK84356.1 trehalose-phosphatase [Sanguibacter sp. HDW7]